MLSYEWPEWLNSSPKNRRFLHWKQWTDEKVCLSLKKPFPAIYSHQTFTGLLGPFDFEYIQCYHFSELGMFKVQHDTTGDKGVEDAAENKTKDNKTDG